MKLQATLSNPFVKKSVFESIIRNLKSLDQYYARSIRNREHDIQELVDDGAAEETAPVGLTTRLDTLLNFRDNDIAQKYEVLADFSRLCEEFEAEFKTKPRLEYNNTTTSTNNTHLTKDQRNERLAKFMKSGPVTSMSPAEYEAAKKAEEPQGL